MDLVPIWYKDRYCTPPPPPHTHTHTDTPRSCQNLEISRNKMCNIRRAVLSGDRSCYKGDNFYDSLFAFLHIKPLLKRSLLLQERIFSLWNRPLFRSGQAGFGGSVGCASDWWSGGCGFNPCQVGNILSLRFGHEIFSLPSADSRRAVVSFWQKNVHNTG